MGHPQDDPSVIGAGRLELPAFRSQSGCSTRLSYAPYLRQCRCEGRPLAAPASAHPTGPRSLLVLERRELRSLGENISALRIGNSAFYDWRPYLALALHAVERRDEALACAIESLDRERVWNAPQDVGAALRTLGLIEGGASGEKLLREAVDVLEGAQWRLEHAKALVELGAALRRGNKRSEAREYLRRGVERAHRLGATALEERAQTELAATGARPRRLMLSGLDSLTPSERRVAEMAADNMTNKDIAQALFVTPKTVEVHLSSVYRKLQISSRAQVPEALTASA